MGGAVETRPDVDDADDACPIVRALGPDWRWKFMLIIVGALIAALLLIWLAKRGSTWWCRRRRAPKPQPQPQPPIPMCTVCRDDVEQGEDAVTLPCGHPYHRGCITQAVDPSLQGARFACGHSSLIIPRHATVRYSLS